MCNGGQISYILTNFTPNITAQNSKHFNYQFLNNRPPSAGQIMDGQNDIILNR